MLITVRLKSGYAAEFEVDPSRAGRCSFVLGIRKCGSTMLNKICHMLARHNSINYVDVAGGFFRNNINFGGWKNDPAVASLLYQGNVYAGFRNMPPCLRQAPLFVGASKLLMVRDPRDALVSEYFSNAYSHVIPVADEDTGARKNLQLQRAKALASTIDDYVLSRAALMASTFMDYRAIWRAPDVLKLRYEDVIFEKRRLIADIVDHFGWSVTDHEADRIVEAVDVRPSQEVPTDFIRKVTPGDHREKLQGETIDALNRALDEPLRFFGYA